MKKFYLLTVLVMFPQIVETMYSPALSTIALAFEVPAQVAAQTLSVYFVAFAVGVFFWGRAADLYGRRPSLLGGLLCYALASFIALVTHDFTVLLIARIISAFGAAVGSVVVQTILRDKYQGDELIKVFSLIGVVLAISPAIGMLSGGLLNQHWGYQGVFIALFLFAITLFIFSAKNIEETKPIKIQTASFITTTARMLKDRQLWLATGLIAIFNISAFSYYTVAPFIFERLDASGTLFGYTGMMMAFGSICGSQTNKIALSRGISNQILFLCALILLLISSVTVYLLSDSLWFVVPMMFIMMSYAMAIPIILGVVLNHYQDCRGTAGAVLGLAYYLLIAIGLGISGWLQNLGLVQISLSCMALLLAQIYLKKIKLTA
ncbi:multidrug effflux MFS transporter [Neisseria sp. Ec49-e6-T10]|uniref:multidrug effflux MFS transporter n=1 Tax=Neisseria sp. Ec49-e6-T10 TaxID=3140744 RepID=UPI003EB9B95F